MPVINAEHLSHARLKALRQAESLPLSALCKQVQRENYHDWQAWERSQDYATVMQGRYHTEVQETSFTLTSDEAVAPVTRPLRDYWTLAQCQRPTTRKAQTKMDLLKLSVSKDALIERETLHALCLADPQVRELPLMTLLPMTRGMADNVRLAVRYRLKDFRSFTQEGVKCHVDATSTDGADGVDMWVHVKRRTKGSVKFTTEPVCQVIGNGKAPLAVRVTPTGESYPDLVRAIGTAASLEEFGQKYYFESDIRKLAQGLLEASCLPLWPGILLALTPEAALAIKSLERLLEALEAGQGTVSLLSLDHTPANRAALAQELAAGFAAALAKLAERLGYPSPTTEKIQAEYDALAARIALAESVLGVEIECLDAQADVELALAAA